MITTNQIERLLDEIEYIPKQFRPDEESYQWLKEILEEIKKQPTGTVAIGFIKSPRITDGGDKL